VSRYERWNALLELLAGAGRLDVDGAARQLGVSAATIRRDLDQLAQQQMLTRTRGGAVAGSVSYDLPLRYRTARHQPAKQRIGQAAAALIGPGAIVGMSGGTTTTEVARALGLRADPPGGAAVTVVTNALNIASELAVRPRVKLVVTGGVARPQSYELVGPLAGGILHEVALDLAIVGVDGLDAERGASAHHEDEASVNALMASRARRVVVVADASKLGQRAFARICAVDAIDVVVTDAAAPRAQTDRLVEAGVTVQRV
jgi:DeoR family transcriptional regulator of aga operon